MSVLLRHDTVMGWLVPDVLRVVVSSSKIDVSMKNQVFSWTFLPQKMRPLHCMRQWAPVTWQCNAISQNNSYLSYTVAKTYKPTTMKIFLTQSCTLYVMCNTTGWICKAQSLYDGSYEDYHLMDEFGSLGGLIWCGYFLSYKWDYKTNNFYRLICCLQEFHLTENEKVFTSMHWY